MMTYYKRVVKAILPKRFKDLLAMLVLVPVITIPGYNIFFKTAPNVVVHTESTYPTEVNRGGTFFVNFDLTWDRSCDITATRYITASDNVEYEAIKDSKNVEKNIRYTYAARIPIPVAIPPGRALIRSDFTYVCDWWSRYIYPIEVRGRDRVINILPLPEKVSMLHKIHPSWF